ncbi:integral membrane protein [Ilyonectria robusta]
MKAYWLVGDLEHCSPEGPPALTQAIATVITDVIVFVLPLPVVLKLHLPRHERVMLASLFSAGLIVVLAGCQRAYWSYYVIEKTYDVTWEGFYLWIWTAVEANLSVIWGNVPALRPLYGVFTARRSGRRIGSAASQGTFHHSRTERTTMVDCRGHGEVVDNKRAESWESYANIDSADAMV